MPEYWLWLAHLPGVKEEIKLALLRYFGSPEAIYRASDADFAGIDLRKTEFERFRDKRLDVYKKALEICDQKKISLLTYQDEAYPERLKNIYNAPLVLYYKGTLPDFDAIPAIGIVGTRKASAYGLSAARRFGYEITRCGGLVVSGLADGIDASAMNAAIDAGGSTVGVLGCGADIVYPAVNRKLYEKTEANGCYLTEYLPGTAPMRFNFPKRNRIISGLSCGVVVVEAPETSGALRTAKFALEQGRDVFAVPGNIDMPTAAGSNALLRDGAGAVSCGWDVMREYEGRFPDKIRKDDAASPPPRQTERPAKTVRQPAAKPDPKKKAIDNGPAAPYIDLKMTLQGLSADEQAIVTAIGTQERLVDDVIAESGLPSAKVLSLLTMLTIRQVIVRHPGNRVSLKR